MTIERRPLNDRDGCAAWHATGFELADDARQLANAHVDAERAFVLSVILEVDTERLLLWIFVAGEESDRGTVFAMGEGDARVGRGGERCSDAGDDFEGNLIDFQLLNFFATTSEDEGIAAFETHYV